MIRASFSLAASAVALLASNPALAASHAWASLDSLEFTLVDLNPFDGVTPTLSFLTSSGSTALSVSVADTAIGESESAGRTRPGAFSFDREFLAQLTNAGAAASIDQSQLAAEGYAFGSGTSFNANASTGGGYSLSLSANSALLITANLNLIAEASNGTCTSYYYYCNGYYGASDTATASGSLSLAYTYSANGVYVSYNHSDSQSVTATSLGGYQYYDWVYNPNTGWSEQVWYTVPGSDDSKSFAGMLSATFTNMTLDTQTAALSLAVGVQGSGSTAPVVSSVPEADTLAMVSVGLLAAGAAARANGATVSPVPEAKGWAMGLAGLATALMLGRRRARG